MTLWVILPVKPFEAAKTRLSEDLSPSQRARLAAWFFHRTLAIALRFAGSRPVLVVTRSSNVIDLAHAAGAFGLLEDDGADLNGALRAAAARALDRGASSILTVASDLPLLETEDLALMTADDVGLCALAPDRWRIGANALFWRGPGLPPYTYGPGSYARHQEAAGGTAHTVSNAGLGFDIDDGEDLRLWSRLQPRAVSVAAAIPALARASAGVDTDRARLEIEEMFMNGETPAARYGERER